jgi:hypothetical protein
MTVGGYLAFNDEHPLDQIVKSIFHFRGQIVNPGLTLKFKRSPMSVDDQQKRHPLIKYG